MVRRVVACALLVALSSILHAQEAFNDALRPADDAQAPAETSANPDAAALIGQSIAAAVPQSAWLDLRQRVDASATTQAAPDWVKAVRMTAASDQNSGSFKTIFRIQLARPPGDYRVLFFRLFFEDKADVRPELTAWDESGTQVLHSGALGSGVNLPSSDSALIPMHGISLIDIEVPGDGKTVRGAYLDWMGSSDVAHPLNAEHRDVIPEPFSAMPPLHPPLQDTEKFGTVTATLAAETIHIGADIQEAAAFEFGVEARPLFALLTFEVASPQIDAPPEVYLNGEDIGAVSLALPELADPGYRGEMEPLVREMHFRYTGWLRAQKIVPVGSLKIGTNTLVVSSPAGTTAAIRATQIQLKYLWDKSDYILQPGH
jgi:hypothetical protein